MVGEAAGAILCLLSWGTRAYLAARYRIKYQIGREADWAWKPRMPDWVPPRYVVAGVPGLGGIACFHRQLAALRKTGGGTYWRAALPLRC